MSKVEGYSLWYNNLGQDPSRDPADNDLMEFYYPYTHFYNWEAKAYAEFAIKVHPYDSQIELQCDYEKDETNKIIKTITFTLQLTTNTSNVTGWNILYFDWIEISAPQGYNFNEFTKIEIKANPQSEEGGNPSTGGSAVVRYGDIP